MNAIDMLTQDHQHFSHWSVGTPGKPQEVPAANPDSPLVVSSCVFSCRHAMMTLMADAPPAALIGKPTGCENTPIGSQAAGPIGLEGTPPIKG